MTDTPPILPAHIEETIRAIARLQERHRKNATPLQRNVERLTALIGRTTFAAGLTAVLLLWAGGNIVATTLGFNSPDPAPFYWLELATSVLALYITIFILTTQRRENELSELRDQLNLELVITNEKKTAKVIQLLEELRRDLPQVHNRHDPEAAVMAQPANPEILLEAIRDTQEIAAETVGSLSDEPPQNPATAND